MQPGADGPSSARKSKLGWVIAPLLIFGSLVAVFGFALWSGDPDRLPSALIGKPVPHVEFPALEGLVESGRPVSGFTSADLASGEVSVVNFWASWCTACVEEHPLLLQLKKKTGVKLYGVDYKDSSDTARRYLGRYGNPYDAVGTDSNGRSAIEWGVYKMPETFVVNGKGEIAYKHVGAITQESLESKLLPAIARAASAAKPVALEEVN